MNKAIFKGLLNN